jgi:GT2 family glycosyltransferase
MRSAPELSILVVSYNTKAMTLACLASIMAETRGQTFEVIVVDNASSDGSAEAIATYARTMGGVITLIALSDNVGFARGNNIAADVARGRYLLLLNPDTLVVAGGIDQLCAAARRVPDAGIWGGRSILADATTDPTCVWRRPTLWSLFCRASALSELLPGSPVFNAEGYGGWQRDHDARVDIITGCFLMIERVLWERLGGFDPRFFMYGEEADLCLRAAGYGARPYFASNAIIIHYCGASEVTRLGKVEKLLTGKATLIERHWDGTAVRIGKALLAAWPLTRWLSLTAAARLTRRPELAERAQIWQTLWQTRAKWLQGYPEPHDLSKHSTYGATQLQIQAIGSASQAYARTHAQAGARP